MTKQLERYPKDEYGSIRGSGQMSKWLIIFFVVVLGFFLAIERLTYLYGPNRSQPASQTIQTPIQAQIVPTTTIIEPEQGVKYNTGECPEGQTKITTNNIQGYYCGSPP